MAKEITRELSREMLIFHRLYSERITRRFPSLRLKHLSQAETFLLCIISDQKKIATKDLVERSMMSKQQVTQLVNQLEEKGLVQRTRPAENRRTVVLETTELAAELQRDTLKTAEAELGTIFAQLDDQALSDYLSAIQTINRILDRFPSGKSGEERAK